MPRVKLGSILHKQRISAASLVPLLTDVRNASELSTIVNGHVMPTVTDLAKLCDILGTNPSDIYPTVADLDYTALMLVTPHRPKFELKDNRDRTGRIWMDAGNEEAKERILEQAKRHGYDGWQKMLDLLITVLNLMDTGLLKLEDGEHDGL